jgi:hypothetical protein
MDRVPLSLAACTLPWLIGALPSAQNGEKLIRGTVCLGFAIMSSGF